MRRGAKPIGSSAFGQRYQRRDGDNPGVDIDITDILRAQADALLESGDVRLLMDRAFRWGYSGADGQERMGLQQVLDALRRRQEALHQQNTDAKSDEPSGRRTTEGQDTGDQMQEAMPQDALQSRDSASQGAERPLARHNQSSVGSRGDGDLGETHGALTGDGTDGKMLNARGGSPAGLRYRQPDATVNAIDELRLVKRALDDLSRLGSVMSLPDIDVQRILAGLPPDDAAWLQAWQCEARKLGVQVARSGSGAGFALPPTVASAIGADIIKSMFRKITPTKGGDHSTWQKGNAGDTVSESSAWEPGEALDLDLVSTVFSAVKRKPHIGPNQSVAIDASDFQVMRRSSSVSVSSVLALDRSRSMGQGGGWVSAKRLALALHELIRRSYPRDSLDLIAFSATAQQVQVRDLPLVAWDRYEHGTSLQGALALSRMLLRRRTGGTRQVILVTDGEPTLATGPSGTVFASPPDQEVMGATLREVDRCTRENIVINLILLTDSDVMRRFGDQVARYNRGRVFRASAKDMGASLLKDYVSR